MKSYFLSVAFAVVFAFGVLAVHNLVKNASDGAAYASIAGSALNAHHMTPEERSRIKAALKTNPDHLLDLSGADIHFVLKDPELTRREAPTIVWQYRTASCVLDLYFVTQKDDASVAPVSYYEVRPRGGAEVMTPQSCLSKML